jgi:membrane fusion protein, multidrug efflux system
MALAKPKLVAAVAAVVVLAAGGAAYVALQNHEPAKTAQGPGGPGGGGKPGGPGSRGATQVDATPALGREFSSRIEALGTLEPRERVELTANASDRVTAVYFEDGQRVRRGAVLLTLAVDEEKAQLESAKATLSEARRQLERNERLSADGAVSLLSLQTSQRDAENAAASVDAAQARIRDRSLIAPFDGILGFRQVSVGAFVSPGQVVATLIDDTQMRLEFGVPSIYVSDLKQGLTINATTADQPGRIFEGQVTSIDNAIDPVTRTVKVRATLPNPDAVLRAGTFMTVDLMSKTRTSLAVPEIAVIAEGPKTFVFVVDETSQPATAKKVEVSIGARERGVVEIMSGLQSGDLVVTDGVLKLRPGAPVKVQQSKAPAQANDASEPRLAAGEGPSDKAGLRQ